MSKDWFDWAEALPGDWRNIANLSGPLYLRTRAILNFAADAPSLGLQFYGFEVPNADEEPPPEIPRTHFLGAKVAWMHASRIRELHDSLRKHLTPSLDIKLAAHGGLVQAVADAGYQCALLAITAESATHLSGFWADKSRLMLHQIEPLGPDFWHPPRIFRRLQLEIAAAALGTSGVVVIQAAGVGGVTSGKEPSPVEPKLVTLEEFAEPLGRSVKTLRNRGKELRIERPKPIVESEGSTAARYSEAELQRWFLSIYPKEEWRFPPVQTVQSGTTRAL